ncbi:MAG: M20/M25/M40 family metallo-hydrolase [Acidimicrobiia bacterium]|nr:M20/M25/M40 family metallo-hydrolase [Acidimicrobiia bacterium]
MTSLDSALLDRTIDRTIELAEIPAPPLDEADRAARVEKWWVADGLDAVGIDSTGNVWGRLRDGRTPALVVCAHLDTVFSRAVAHSVERDGPYLRGPSVGDDSVALASISTLDLLVPDESARAIWALATIGEEGLGNLAGVTAALARPAAPVGAMIALEGNWLGRVCTVGVGSVRWRVELTGPGGHSWEQADAPSSVHALGRVVAALDGLVRPSGGRSSVNVARVGGGEAINARARAAWFEVDMRADTQLALDELVAGAAQALDGNLGPDIECAVEVIGERPAGSVRDDHPLVTAATEALAGVGRRASLTAASTDANAAHALGIPAIAIGVTVGAGEHTEDEWIDTRTLADGLEALAATVSAAVEVI